MNTNVHFLSNLARFVLERKMFHTKFVEKIKTHIFFDNFFFSENLALYEMMWRNIVECVTDDNMAHAYCMFYT
jgi:hypothetical protein